jgi:histidyl-tRNA synthetase
MKQIISSLKGTRDFYPADKIKQNWLLQHIRAVSESYGYQEYEVPYLEKLELFAAKSGEELVKKQSFVFQDRDGEEITLRPELTPSLARMVAQRQNELVYPMRWWAFGPIWRYERPQKGRSREFFQWNIDLIGINSPEADAELLAIAADFFKSTGLTPDQVKIKINDRRLMFKLLREIGIPEEKTSEVLRLIDRKDKLSEPDWAEMANSLGMDQGVFSKLKGVLDNNELWKHSEELTRCFSALETLNARDYVVYDPKVIRGLDYYTGIVFEAFDLEGGRAILGGGHYDNLVEDVGGTSLPGVGFAMGDVMISIILEKYGLLPQGENSPAEVMVTVFEAGTMQISLKISSEMRKIGIRTICYPEVAKLPKQLKFADRMGIRFVVIIGPDEVEKQSLILKDLKTGDQKTLKMDAAASETKRLLA